MARTYAHREQKPVPRHRAFRDLIAAAEQARDFLAGRNGVGRLDYDQRHEVGLEVLGILERALDLASRVKPGR